MVNHIYSRSVIGQPEPFIGMGATVLHWTDRNAGTIVKVEKIGGKTYVHVQGDKVERIDGNDMSENQEYAYRRNPDGNIGVWRQRANGSWENVFFNKRTNRWNLKKDGNLGLGIGYRLTYHDYSF